MLLSPLPTRKTKTSRLRDSLASATATKEAAVVHQPVKKNRRPIRSRKLQPELHDPEDLGLHTSFYPPHNQLLGTLSNEASASIVPAAYVPLSPGLEDQEIQTRGGYLSTAVAAHAILSTHRSSRAGEESGGANYRYTVTEGGEVIDMLLVKRLSVPEAFKRARPRTTALLSQVVGFASPEEQEQEQQEAEQVPTSQGLSTVEEGTAESSSSTANQAEAAPVLSTRRGRYLEPVTGHRQEGYIHQQQGLQPSQQQGAASDVSSSDAASRAGVSHGRLDPDRRDQAPPLFFLDLPPPVRMGPPLIPAEVLASERESVGTQGGPQGQAASAPHKVSKSRVLKPAPLPVLRAFPYCVGPTDLFDALWELDIVDKVQWVGSLGEADMVIHRRQRSGELRQFAYDSLRAKAHARGIPFVSINAPTAEELRLVLMPVFRLYTGELLPADLGLTTTSAGGSAKKEGTTTTRRVQRQLRRRIRL